MCIFANYICEDLNGMGAENCKNDNRDDKWDENVNLIFSTQTLAGVLGWWIWIITQPSEDLRAQ